MDCDNIDSPVVSLASSQVICGEKDKLDTMKLGEEIKAEADTVKNLGNEEFRAKNFVKAILLYTDAIQKLRSAVEEITDDGELHTILLKDSSCAIYLVNRSMCHLKIENYGSALVDVADALELDPEPKIRSKAYYRQGFAHYALLKNEDALRDFKEALALSPNDRKTRNYVTTIQKEMRISKFLEAISKPDAQPLYNTIDLESLDLPPISECPCWVKDVKLPKVDDLMTEPITHEFIKNLAEYFRKQNTLPPRLAAVLVLRAINLLKTQPNCVNVTVEDGKEITICGDVHGQYYDLLNIFDMNGYPSDDNPYIFNGDFVDRGSWSVECALMLFACKVAYPDNFYLSRGNHETKSINRIYGFKGECDSKFKVPEMYELFSEAFQWLPLCHTINNEVFCVHGGLPSNDGQSIADINELKRYSEPTDLQTADQILLNDLLWADPRPVPGRVPSPRGVSTHFGPDVTERFLELNGLKCVIRSHEVKDEGYEVMHGGKVITVFSAPNYCDTVKNKGAFIRLKGPELIPQYTTFSEVKHPNVGALRYASPLIQMT